MEIFFPWKFLLISECHSTRRTPFLQVTVYKHTIVHSHSNPNSLVFLQVYKEFVPSLPFIKVWHQRVTFEIKYEHFSSPRLAGFQAFYQKSTQDISFVLFDQENCWLHVLSLTEQGIKSRAISPCWVDFGPIVKFIEHGKPTDQVVKMFCRDDIRFFGNGTKNSAFSDNFVLWFYLLLTTGNISPNDVIVRHICQTFPLFFFIILRQSFSLFDCLVNTFCHISADFVRII